MAESSWTVTAPRIIDVGGVTSLKLGIVRGRFEITAHAGDTARIEVAGIQGDPLAVSLVNGRLEVRHQLHGAQGWFRNLMGTVHNSSGNSVALSLALPAGVDVEAGTVSGHGTVSATSGRTRLYTVAGSVLADDTSGSLAVSTVSGGATVRSHRGALTVRSVSGEVAASGEFSHVRAHTVSGNLSFDLRGFTQDFGANSVSGDVTVRLQHDVGVDIIAKSATGAVVIDDQKYLQPGGTVQTIAGPDTQLMLVRTNSVSGTTSIFHNDPPQDGGTGP